MKNYLFRQSFIYSLITLLIGILLVSLNGEVLANILFIILGVLIIVSNLSFFISSLKNLKYKTSTAISQFLISTIIMVLGILLIILRQSISAIIGGIILVFIVFDLIINRKNIKIALSNQIPLFICALILIIFGFGGVLDLLCTIIGIIMIVISILSLIGSLLLIGK